MQLQGALNDVAALLTFALRVKPIGIRECLQQRGHSVGADGLPIDGANPLLHRGKNGVQ